MNRMATIEIVRPLSPSESRDDNDVAGSYETSGSVATTKTNDHSKTQNSHVASPRMLLSSHGERVYVGAAASIAFLQTVRRVVAGQIGPSNFSHNVSNEMMLEVETPQSTDDPLEITVDQKLQFLQCYFSVTKSFIDIFDPSELEAYMTNSGKGVFVTNAENEETNRAASSIQNLNQLRQASLDLVLAIGAQCTSKQDAQNIARTLFSRAQRQALSEMIQDPDIDMVRTYLLMAFYMLGECRRNTAYMYLSVAARAAIALGLHSPSSYPKHGPMDANDKLRLRIWMTCRIGDKLVNSLLGRPATTIGIVEELEPFFVKLDYGNDHNLRCVVAAYKIVSIIDEINTKLYGEQDVRPVVLERLLEAVDNWKRESLPSLKETIPDASPSSRSLSTDAKKGSIGVIHVSCLYYFAVILASRPVFISALTLQQRHSGQDSPMSQACLNAATYLAQTCTEALDSEILESNMCIMKALVFAAGLILGVDRFAKPGTSFEIEGAFKGAKRVLGFLATRSPQASHYLDILNSLSNAIAEQRSRTGLNRTNRYVSRLFDFGSSVSAIGTLAERPLENSSDINTLPADLSSTALEDFSSFADSPSRWANYDQIDPELFTDWETFNIRHWDNFPFLI